MWGHGRKVKINVGVKVVWSRLMWGQNRKVKIDVGVMVVRSRL